jgi:NADH dehydrogenase [ubiquinone] 1 alpha subcomplex assembly factor 1
VAPSPRSLFEFSGAADEPRWVAVNDGVMGGRSRGAGRIVDGLLHFSGVLSLEHGGGFASLRSEGRRFDLLGARALLLRVKGDGRRYQLRVATGARVRGTPVWYSASFDTVGGQWTQIRTPIDALLPRYRGALLAGPPLDLAHVEQVGLLVGDRQAGPFALEVDWIRVE